MSIKTFLGCLPQKLNTSYLSQYIEVNKLTFTFSFATHKQPRGGGGGCPHYAPHHHTPLPPLHPLSAIQARQLLPLHQWLQRTRCSLRSSIGLELWFGMGNRFYTYFGTVPSLGKIPPFLHKDTSENHQLLFNTSVYLYLIIA